MLQRVSDFFATACLACVRYTIDPVEREQLPHPAFLLTGLRQRSQYSLLASLVWLFRFFRQQLREVLAITCAISHLLELGLVCLYVWVAPDVTS